MAMLPPCYAQVSGEPNPITGDPASVRPVLVAVEFVGNTTLAAPVLQANIATQASTGSFIGSFFRLFSGTPFTAPLESIGLMISDSVRPVVHQALSDMVDSLSGSIRYLNLTTAAADTATIKRIYNQYGFHDAQVGIRVALDTADNAAIVRYLIREGPRYTISGITYLGIDSLPPQIQASVRRPKLLEPGEPFLQQLLEQEVEQSITVLRNNGWAFARRSSITVLKVDPSSSVIAPYDTVLVRIAPGRRYRFGPTEFIDDTAAQMCVGQEEIFKQLVYEPGEWYSQEKVEQSVANLYNVLGIFELARIDTSSVLSDGERLGMQVKVRYRNRVDLTLSPLMSFERRREVYRTYFGGNIEFGLIDPFCRGGRLSSQLRGRTRTGGAFAQDYQLGVSLGYYAPAFIMEDLSARMSASGDLAIEDRLTENSVSVGERTVQLEEVLFRADRLQARLEAIPRSPMHAFFNRSTAPRLAVQYLQYQQIEPYLRGLARRRILSAQLNGTLAAGDDSSLVESVTRVLADRIYRNQVLQGDSRALVESLDDPEALAAWKFLNVTYLLGAEGVGEHRDNFFDPTSGFFVQGIGELGVTGRADGMYAKVELDYRRYSQLSESTVFAWRTHGGLVWPFSGVSLVPVPSLFFAGGANSIRGWSAREMLATEPEPQNGGATAAVINDILRESRRLLGGLALLELSAELRWKPFAASASDPAAQQFAGIVLMVFADAGNAFARRFGELNPAFIVENTGVSVGAGVGYTLPIGPIWFGLGQPIYDPVNFDAGERWFWQNAFSPTLQFSLGYAF